MQITTPRPVPTLTPSDTFTDYLDFNDDNLDSDDMYEGSGSLINHGSGDGKECHGDDEDCILVDSDDFSRSRPTPKITTEKVFTPSFDTTPSISVPIEDQFDSIDFEPQDPNIYDYPESEDTEISSTTEETIFIQEETDIPIVFGPPDEDIPTFLYDNRILVVAIYSSLVFLLVSSILVVSIVVGVKHCRKKMGFVRVSGEDGSSTDSTASSDLPIIKKVSFYN